MADENCVTCSKEKTFDGEGHFTGGYWFCCWNCTEKAKQRGLIDNEDIKNRTFGDR